MKTRTENFLLITVFLFIIAMACSVVYIPEQVVTKEDNLPRFSSGEELINAFKEAQKQGSGGWFGSIRTFAKSGVAVQESATADASAPTAAGGREYSDTNIQVEGVDEADIIKTDGDYIYTIAQGNLVIIKAYPADEAEILSTTKLKNFHPQELFIHNDRLLIFGTANYEYEAEPMPVGEPVEKGVAVDEMMIAPDYYPRYISVIAVKLYDISDKKDPDLLRTVDFEGSYLTSRKIKDDVYFVVNSYPRWYREYPPCTDIVPLYRDMKAGEEQKEMEPVAKCTDIGYIPPIQAQNFITVASISMTDENADIEKEVIVGSGQNVYASLNNLYIAQTSWPRYNILGEIASDSSEQTVITKFSLDDGKIKFESKGEVKGHILNQFSMDEWDNHFRIATTAGSMWGRNQLSSNNVYVLDEDMDLVGELEDLAPGERIYSVRFMGEKGYVVTFKKVDPLFVIDLSDHENPTVLGKLKIPGYSDYLHPYDETHIIGIGKDTIEADEGLIENRGLDFAWYQGLKMAIFDVSDVENPIEMHKVIIGDRGTDSEALHNHKAFLFDRERNLLVIPITLAEIPESIKKADQSVRPQYGDFVFQGAYVYNINLEDGFKLRGRVTHYDDDEVFKKSGYYFRGDYSIRRSLYIEDVLYTLSSSGLQLNDLDSLDRLEVLEFEKGQNSQGYPERYY